MQRRKFVVGLGSLAAGSAAAMGTGAFTTGEVPRSATVRVSNDDTDAKLGFSTKVGGSYPSTNGDRSPYAKVTGGALEIDFSAESATGSASGMNPNGAVYTFDRVFKIVNQGSTNILPGLDISGVRGLDAIDEAEVHTNGANDAAPDIDLDTTLDFGTDPVSIANSRPNAVLSPGQSLLVDWRFETANKSDYGTPFEETPEVTIGGVDVDA